MRGEFPPRGTPVVDDEVAMHFGNARPSHREVLEAELLDQSPRRSLGRILKMQPALAPIGWVSRRLRCESAIRASISLLFVKRPAQRGRKGIVL